MHKALLCAFISKFWVIKKKVRNKTVLLLTIHRNVSFSSENQRRQGGPRVSCAANIAMSEACCCLHPKMELRK